MTSPFQRHPRLSPDLQNNVECDTHGHLSLQTVGIQLLNNEKSERDGGEGRSIYVPFEARKGMEKRKQDRISISNLLSLSSAFAANLWPESPETVRTLYPALTLTLCGITPYSERIPLLLFAFPKGVFPLFSDTCVPYDRELVLLCPCYFV